MTVAEAGAFLGLSRSASYGAAKTGAIPTLRLGRRLVVPTHAFREMLGVQPGPTLAPQVATATSLDPTLRRALIAGLEAFLQVLKSGKG